MHVDDSERLTAEDGDLREAIVAADDTGMVRQHEVLVVSELDDSPAGDPERAR